MNILIACEFSGIVRDAFKAKGHYVWSCDLLPTEKPGLHFQNDVRIILGEGWDMLIAHPPCTRLCTRGRFWTQKRGLWKEEAQAINFFMALANASIPMIAVENPVGIMSTRWRKPDQYINPFDHGHPDRKKTGLWLKGLPLLVPTNPVMPEDPTYIDRSGQKRYFVDKMPPSQTRQRDRSRTFPGIAAAMADQWGIE